jgi:acetyl-CoA carboxylase biotin carboxyl carrier protein
MAEPLEPAKSEVEPVADAPTGAPTDAPTATPPDQPPDVVPDPPAPLTPLGAEPLAPPEAGPLDDPADASLLALIDRLAGLLDRTDLTELEVQVGSTGLVLRKPSAIAAPPAVATAAPGAAAPTAGTAAPSAEAATNGAAPHELGPPPRPSVKAPLTGIWYSSPAPGSAPYVTAGGEVGIGQVIGLIEAMKLFNEIKSDLAGRVVRVHAEEGKLVKAKQPLIEVDPL